MTNSEIIFTLSTLRDKLNTNDRKCIEEAIGIIADVEPNRLVTGFDFVENVNMDLEGNLPVWMEFRDQKNDGWGIIDKSYIDDDPSNYNITVRYWFRCPTYAETSATPWDKDFLIRKERR